MGRSDGDAHHGDDPVGGEPEPAEMWIDPGSSDAPGAGSPQFGGPAPGSGGLMRNRWIALAIGFVVLVAVVAVQHFAGGGPSTGSSAAPSSQQTAGATTPSPATISAGTAASSDSPTTASAASSADRTVRASAAPDGDAEPSTTPDTTSPTTTTVAAGALPGAGKWTLFGYGPAGVVRYQPASGRLTVTPVPKIQSGNVLSFVVTEGAAIIRSMDFVEGYLVPDGKPAEPLRGLLDKGTRVLPGPDSQHVWLVASNNAANSGQERDSLVLVDTHGKATGTRIELPAALGTSGGYSILPDGAGHALVVGISGVYEARPDGLHLITHGQVVAAGPTRFLVDECNAAAKCSSAVIDRSTGKKHVVTGLTMGSRQAVQQGVISPDGRYAAVAEFATGGTQVHLIDLRKGTDRTLTIDAGGTDASSGLLFTPDGKYLLVAGTTEVSPVRTSTGKTGQPLPIPPVSMLAVRPAG